MGYTDTWLEGRKLTKKQKELSLGHLKKQVKELDTLNEKEFTKLAELVDLYLQSHDFVTQVGLEISKIADKAKGY